MKGRILSFLLEGIATFYGWCSSCRQVFLSEEEEMNHSCPSRP